MICPNCNNAGHESDAMFCDNCGASLTAMACHSCNTTDHRPGAKFCRHCGSSLFVLECPKCHYVGHVPGALFCDQCGSPLEYEAASKDNEGPAEEQSPAPYHLKDNAPAGVAAVDLGMPSGTLWATCNVGATKPEGFGTYLSWGETEGKETYTKENYLYYDGPGKGYRDLGECISGTKYDVARAKWGEAWQMPTHEQTRELLKCCEREWTTINGIEGHKFIGPNGNSIFLPAAGYRSDTFLHQLNYSGSYWAGTKDPCFSYYAYGFYFFSDGAFWYPRSDYNSRFVGHPVRPVATCKR